MPVDLVYPIELHDPPITGVQANGEVTFFSDLLSEGDRVGPAEVEGGDAAYVDARVVRRDDGSLWVEALSASGGESA